MQDQIAAIGNQLKPSYLSQRSLTEALGAQSSSRELNKVHKFLQLCLISILAAPFCSAANEMQTIRTDYGISMQLPTWMSVKDAKTMAALEQISQEAAASRRMAVPAGRQAVLSASGRDMSVRITVTNPTPTSQAEIDALRSADIQQIGRQLESQVRQTAQLNGGVTAYTSNKVANRRSFIYEYQRSTLFGASVTSKTVVVYQLVSGNNLIEMTVSFPAGDRSSLAVS